MDQCQCIHKSVAILTNAGLCAKCMKPFRHEPIIAAPDGYKCPACDEYTYKADCTSCGYAKGMNVKQHKALLEAEKLNEAFKAIGVSASEAGAALGKMMRLMPKRVC